MNVRITEKAGFNGLQAENLSSDNYCDTTFCNSNLILTFTSFEKVTSGLGMT